MAKKVALKTTRALMLESEAKQKSLPNSELVQSWRGRVMILNAEKSAVAARMGIEKDGEYAIKVR